MELSKRLALNLYFLDQFGCENFDELQEKLKGVKEGVDSDGKSYFADALIIRERSKIEAQEVLRHDQAIREYVERLSRNRRTNIRLKYFQYLAVLFTEIFLERYFSRRKQLVSELNSFVDRRNKQITEPEEKLDHFSETDLRKLAYSMATGSGKTLILHINYWQFLKHTTEELDNIILITPNEGLSKQHHRELQKSGIPCRLYSENIATLTLLQKEVLIIDIHKLTEEKKGAGVRVEVDYFEGENLVFIDEGHKGQATEERTWKNLREKLAKTGFIFEYSATFAQVISPRNQDLLEEYSKAIIFDYSYKFFYNDGYGKDFYVYNLSEKSFQEKTRDLILTANLIQFFEQVLLYEKHREELEGYLVEKPLWAFIGSKVSGAGINSDVLKVVEFLKLITENRDLLKRDITRLLDGKSGITDPHGNDVFQSRLEYIRENGYRISDIYEKLFNSTTGSLSLHELECAEGEIALKLGEGEYFGVINIGDVLSFKKLLAKKGIETRTDSMTPSVFERINEGDSNVTVLIGAKKFIEGWDSWRVCSMGLINMGKGEGPQIIQMFGRGVRLKGRDFSLKRSVEKKYRVRALETLNIFALDADYLKTFLETIRREEVEFEELELPIRIMSKKKWENLPLIETRKDFDFSRHPIQLEIDRELMGTVKVDIRPKITIAHGLETAEAETSEDTVGLGERYLDLLGWDEIYLEILDYKLAQGYSNLAIQKGILPELMKGNGYLLYALPEQVMLESFTDLSKIRQIVVMILKSYVDRFYNLRLQQKESNELQITHLTRDHENLSFRKYVLKIPKGEEAEIEKIRKLLRQAQKLYEDDMAEIPSVHFDRHLYTPLVAFGKGRDFIKSDPPRLNKGETQFVKYLRDYVRTNREQLKDRELFLLRNLSLRGVRFFQTSGFYPDFMMWIRRGKKVTVAFIDPKGIRNSGNFNDEKIQLHKRIKEIETKLGDSKLRLESFILSVSKYYDIKNTFDDGKRKRDEFSTNHVLFLEDANMIQELLDKLL